MDLETGEIWNKEAFLNLFNKPAMADLIISVGMGQQEQIYYAHELIVSAASENLKDLCRTEAKEDNRRVINLPHLDSEAMGIVLRWIYGDRHPFSGVTSTLLASHIIFAASDLGLPTVGRVALDYLGTLIDEKTDNESSIVGTNDDGDDPTVRVFTDPPCYWLAVKDICNWAYGWSLNELSSVVEDLTTAFPTQPMWLTELSKYLNPTLLAVLLLEREQRLRNLSSCINCQPPPMKGLNLPDGRKSQCSGCGAIGPAMNIRMEVVKLDTVIPISGYEEAQVAKVG
ncbi:hypothetical protein TWF506_004385 [Arthrobotrys conoides]|uniref:BTB domain-containing protein n=1 Tax=Arthrobotrys conoides TaxID=74498 RepID=A0AAN8RTI0_9PEZI